MSVYASKYIPIWGVPFIQICFLYLRKYFLYWGHGKKSQEWLTRQHSSLLSLCPLRYCPPVSYVSRTQAETAVTNIVCGARFEVLKAVLLKIPVFWQVALCNLGEWFLMFQRHQVLRNVVNCYPNDIVSLYRDWIFRLCLYVNRMAMWKKRNIETCAGRGSMAASWRCGSVWSQGHVSTASVRYAFNKLS